MVISLSVLIDRPILRSRLTDSLMYYALGRLSKYVQIQFSARFRRGLQIW